MIIPKKYKLQVHGISVIGKTDDLPKSLITKFDEIFICCPSAKEKEMRKIIEHCKKAQVNLLKHYHQCLKYFWEKFLLIR